jgi:hypothetical protein
MANCADRIVSIRLLNCPHCGAFNAGSESIEVIVCNHCNEERVIERKVEWNSVNPTPSHKKCQSTPTRAS